MKTTPITLFDGELGSLCFSTGNNHVEKEKVLCSASEKTGLLGIASAHLGSHWRT